MKQNIFRRKSLTQVLTEARLGIGEGHSTQGLHKTLGVRDLTMMGIAAIVGAGIFSTIGKASFNGGPGIILLFIFVAIACAFTAVCYAEFASMAPVAGSAYTYSYVAFGEIIAWIIGWDLLMEYAIGNIAVAISWSDYFTSLMDGLGVHIPKYLTMDYWTAQKAAALTPGRFTGNMSLITSWNEYFVPVMQKWHFPVNPMEYTNALTLPCGNPDAMEAWQKAPVIGPVRLICDLPAFLITVIITVIIYIGIQESKRMTNIMVVLKIAVILLVIIAGAFYVNTNNWTPFLPNGMGGVFSGTAAVFFSYIGFDAISTTAEECKDPQRDLPKAMFNSLIICTIIYIIIALVLTGMVSYGSLNVGDPLAYVFKAVNLNWLSGVIAVSAVVATASVLLVFQLGQPRIWMSMSRDGLLPPAFSRIHPRFKTPSFSTVLTGIVVGVPALFMNLDTVVDLTSVGTLFAFVLVSGGILRLQQQRKKMHPEDQARIPESRFKTPYINGKWIVPALFLLTAILFAQYYPGGLKALFSLEGAENTGWAAIREKVPFIFFGLVFLIMAILSFIKDYSLIPVLGFLSCSYLLCESGTSNWERFLIWLVVGLLLYFMYGIRKSKLRATD